MITFSKLEKKGHLGNQLFQIASTIGIAIENNQDFCFPNWSYNSYFENQLPILENQKFIHYKEENFNFEPKIFDDNCYDLEGWFQSEKYFDILRTRHYFKFNEDLIESVKSKYRSTFSKRVILISIRRGDFVDHQDYFQLPINYYLNALIDNFKDWQNYNLVVVSDDVAYCKFHFSFLDNVFFADNLSAIEQLVLASLCDDFIISNSTFSWWCAWFGEKENSKIIRPLHYFTEFKQSTSNDSDYFPERWIIYNHLDKKIDLGNVKIVLNNQNKIIEEYLNHNFQFTNRIVFFNEIENDNSLKSQNILLINNYIIPPLCLFFANENKENSVFYLKGKVLKISKFWDLKVFSKQWDFGLFSRILKVKNNTNRQDLLFLKVLNHISGKNNILDKNLNLDDYSSYFTFAGEINGFFEFDYFLVIQKRKLVVYIKTKIKRIIRFKK